MVWYCVILRQGGIRMGYAKYIIMNNIRNATKERQ